MFLLKAYIAIHNFNIVCISETYLDSNTSPDDNNLDISGYNLIQSDRYEELFIYIINTFYIREFSVFNIFKNGHPDKSSPAWG